ncbi:chemotaxis protein [Dethiothermospora halolimnae]|uniref:chemotaxis protein n=1 Tax=Dethiothermospora halolimnae TaxID=3114390 RepID=UPI003CCC2EA8
MTRSKKILLEIGTNELEIIEFKVFNNHFGINVAKVREVIKTKNYIPVPKSHPCIKGVMTLREHVITVIDLVKYLETEKVEDNGSKFFIITHFNKIRTAFEVHSVVGIQRLSWEEIEVPDSTMNKGSEGIVSGIVKKKDRLITILDFEKILSDINPRTGIQVSDIENMGSRLANDKPVLIAEDSELLSKMLKSCLNKAGYNNLKIVSNGKDAWEFLKSIKESKSKDIKEKIACVITDIEMPQMDGYHLTKLIKEDVVLNTLPVIMFSSLINDETMERGKKVGADAQVGKPEITKLVGLVDRLTN